MALTVLQSHHFRSGEELETTLHRYVWLYNQQLPQSALGSKSPLLAMKDWHKLKPKLFKKQPYYLPGCDTYVWGQDRDQVFPPRLQGISRRKQILQVCCLSGAQLESIVRNIRQRGPDVVRLDPEAVKWKPVAVEPDGAVAEPGRAADVPAVG